MCVFNYLHKPATAFLESSMKIRALKVLHVTHNILGLYFTNFLATSEG